LDFEHKKSALPLGLPDLTLAPTGPCLERMVSSLQSPQR